ncbi:hypothetical protein B0J14DRAFT_577134 [Halenospora varia]|nr:hypothetical protein B0J14DRAFT_577134 [Halenospora varia]
MDVAESSNAIDGTCFIRTNTQILNGGLPWTKVPAPCECRICQSSFRDSEKQSLPSGWSYSLELTGTYARNIAAKHIENIDEDRKYLQEQWSGCGKTIASRWKKKSREKRAACLKAADESLFEKQWIVPLYTSRQLESTGQLDMRKYRQGFLLEYLNVDGLKGDPAKLLGLVQNRACFTPEQWALHDNKKLDWCWDSGMADIDGSRLCMVMYGSRYGELVPWEKRAAHAREIIGFPRARLVLEAQERLYRFLRKVVEQLVEGITLDNSDQNVVPEYQLEFKRSGHIDLWSTYINQPYSPPPTFDVDAMCAKALARLHTVSDHLWLLQTDPAYLRRTIQIAADNYPSDHPLEEIHKHTVSEIHHEIWMHWSWDFIVEACQNVKDMRSRFRDNTQPGQTLPPKYEQVLQELELLLESQLRIRTDSLPTLLSFRPGFRQYFTHDYSDPDQVAMTGHIDLPNLPNKDPLFYILHILPQEPTSKKPENFDVATKWAFLEDHLASTTHSDAARLDGTLYDRYNDYASIQELYLTLSYHLPMPELLETLTSYSSAKIKQLGRPTVFRDQIEKILEEEYMLPRDHDASKALLRFTKAFDSHLTKAQLDDQMRLEQFDATQAAMGNFWAIMRRKRQTLFRAKKLWTSDDIATDLKIISADLEEDYKVMVVADRQKILDRIERLSRRPQVSSDPMQKEWGSTPAANETIKPSAKSMKRPKKQEETVVPDLEELAIDSGKSPQPASIPVKGTTYRILNMMFSPTAEATTKLINWDDFVQAMQDVGFSARQTTGSEVVFQPEDNDHGWSGRINFLKPHPVAKIDRVMLRAMGKRMGKWYGWGDGTFMVQKR